MTISAVSFRFAPQTKVHFGLYNVHLYIEPPLQDIIITRSKLRLYQIPGATI